MKIIYFHIYVWTIQNKMWKVFDHLNKPKTWNYSFIRANSKEQNSAYVIRNKFLKVYTLIQLNSLIVFYFNDVWYILFLFSYFLLLIDPYAARFVWRQYCVYCPFHQWEIPWRWNWTGSKQYVKFFLKTCIKMFTFILFWLGNFPYRLSHYTIPWDEKARRNGCT